MSARENLPPELIEAILRLQPAKSLGRFKSVSKPWHSLISNPQFIKTHLHLNKSKNLILLSDTKSLFSININQLLPYPTSDEDDRPATGKELTFQQPSIRWEEILGCCNGLVLAKDEDDSIFLMNPTARKLSKLPVSPFALPIGESFVMYGFGYDSSTDDFKVVSISFWDTDNEHNPDCTDMFVSVYSLKNNSWRKLPDSPYDHAVGHLVSGVLLNGNLHWLTSKRPEYSSAIAAFSLVDEEFREIELPESINNDNGVFNELAVVGGKLGLFGTPVGKDLWVMEEYGVRESWSIHGVVLEDDRKPVCWVDDDRNLDMVLGDEEGVFVYNVDERRCKNVRIVGGPDGSGFAIGGTYVESLVSPLLGT